MKPQIYFAVVDSVTDSDFFAFNFIREAIIEVVGWIDDGLHTKLMTGNDDDWGRLYVCSVDADTVPTEYSDGWSLWNYAPAAIRYRDVFCEWNGDAVMKRKQQF